MLYTCCILCWKATACFQTTDKGDHWKSLIPFENCEATETRGPRMETGSIDCSWLPHHPFLSAGQQAKSIALWCRAIQWLHCRNRYGDHISLRWWKKFSCWKSAVALPCGLILEMSWYGEGGPIASLIRCGKVNRVHRLCSALSRCYLTVLLSWGIRLLFAGVPGTNKL